MRRIFAPLAVLAILAAPIVAHASVLTYTIDGILNVYTGGPLDSTYTSEPGHEQIGTVTGTFEFDTTTKTFEDIDLTYIVPGQGFDETFTNAGTTANSYYGNPFYIAFNTDNNGDTAALELTEPGLALCTLDSGCPGGNASNLEIGSYNVGSATFSVTGATPEPSSLILLGTGILTAAGAARRKLRNA